MGEIEDRLEDLEAALQARVPDHPPGVVLYEDDALVSQNISPRFRHLNFIGATVDRSTDTTERADIIIPGGQGGTGPFEYDYLLDKNWATVVSNGLGSEGDSFTTFYGATVRLRFCVQGVLMQIAYIALHYGCEYLAWAVQSVQDAVDEIHIFYVAQPSYGYSQGTACPDSRVDLEREARRFCNKPLHWHDCGPFRGEGEHRDHAVETLRN
ncbi:hypothetical protein LCGC14_2739090, partial [marine sediment metagenome]